MVFGYALGIVPTELLGKGVQKVAGAGTQYAVKKYVSKATLEAVQAFGRRIGIKILQRSIIKYAVPIVSAGIGSSYNYFTTKTVGRIAKTHLKNRGKVTEELRKLISKKNTYHIVFPAAVMFMAQVDGKMTSVESEFYKAVLSRLKLEEYEQEEFEMLLGSRENILEAVVQIEDGLMRENFVKVLALMAIYDGEFSGEEKEFLIDVAAKLDIKIDIEDIERQAKDYKIIVEESVLKKSAGVVKGIGSAVGSSIMRPFGKEKGDEVG